MSETEPNDGLTPEQVERIFGKEDAEPEQKTDPVAEADKPEPEPESAESESHDGELEDAWKRLERDGWTKAQLKRFSRSDIVEMGAKRAQRQDKIDSDYKELHSYRDAKTKAEKAKPEHDSASELVDLSADLKALEADGGPEVAKAIAAIVSKINAIEKRDAARDAERGRAERSRLQSAFVGAYPALANGKVFDAILAIGHSNLDGASSVDEAFKAACDATWPKAAEPKQPIKSDRHKDAAQAPARSKPTVVKLTQEQRELNALLAIEGGGKSRDELKRIYAGD